jgi:tricorn protease
MSTRLFRALIALIALVAFLPLGEALAQTKLLRFPDVFGDQVVFTYAGDLWLAPVDGGRAVRLTAHPGVELFAKFSPDGRWIAFTGQYDGDEQVYVVPATGGAPRQLTFYPAMGPLPHRWGYDNVVYGWTPDGSAVLFRSLRYAEGIGEGRLYTVDVDGGLPVPLPMPYSGAGEFLPDGKTILYSPLMRDFRNWKRYEGGWAQDLWTFDLETHEAKNFTNNVRTDRDPMWAGDKVYFVSDRTGTLNIFSYDLRSEQIVQITDSTTWDVRWPAADSENRIVYEFGGELMVLNTDTGRSQAISITVPDDGLATRPSRIQVSNYIEDFELSPMGERALFVARGDVFSAPIEDGPTRNLTRSSNAHDKGARWSPDGSTIAFISDRDGEEEIYLIAQDGSGDPEQLTDGNSTYLFGLEWSPDSEQIAYTNSEGKLLVVNVESKQVREIADERYGLIGGGAWSPNGGHIAFTLNEETGFSSVHVWSAADGQVRRVTDALFNEFSPTWDPEGNYLYYLSDREFAPQLGSFDWNFVVDRETYIYALALRKDVPHPFPPKSDEVTVEKADEKGEGEEAAGEEAAEGEAEGEASEQAAGEAGSDYIEIDFDGLAQRVARIPVEADNYGGLVANEGNLLYFKGGPGYYGRGSDVRPTLMIFNMDSREAGTLAEGVFGYAVSADGSKVLAARGGSFQLFNASPGASGKPVSTSGLYVDRIPKQEWYQIFDEVWRRFRDFFYVENMHGYDWVALRDQYRPLLQHVAHRSDLNYVIGEMISELSVSHTYIAGGDWEIPDRPRVALPGAHFELDADAGRYRIAEILEGHNEESKYRSPLTEIGVDISVGDYVLAINGDELRGSDNPYRLLRNQAGDPVTFTVNDQPSFEGAREVTINPLTSETNLNYFAWVAKNRERVERETDGRIGYMHIPDMGVSGIYEFIKWFYGQTRKEGLIVDVRGNGGGNVSAMIIERLRRELLATGFNRTSEAASTYPQVMFNGHMVALLNETSASDGDIFPAMFKKAGLGKLIGKRSWGGVIGITSYGPLIDGGQVNVPQFGFASPEGEWVIEGYGVEPDIEVDNDPQSVINGDDPQLERAIQEILTLVNEDPRRLPTKPADPIKRQ